MDGIREKIAAFHRQRRMFVILNGKLLWAPEGVEWGHAEWFQRTTFNVPPGTTRGFVDSTGIYAYHGDKFEGSIVDVFELCGHLEEFGVGPDTPVFIGMVRGEPGTRWKPLHTLGAVHSLVERR